MKNNYSKTEVIKAFSFSIFYSIKICFYEVFHLLLGLLNFFGIRVFTRKLNVFNQYIKYDKLLDEISYELRVHNNPDEIMKLGITMSDLIKKGIEPEKNNVIAIYKEQNNG